MYYRSRSNCVLSRLELESPLFSEFYNGNENMAVSYILPSIKCEWLWLFPCYPTKLLDQRFLCKWHLCPHGTIISFHWYVRFFPSAPSFLRPSIPHSCQWWSWNCLYSLIVPLSLYLSVSHFLCSGNLLSQSHLLVNSHLVHFFCWFYLSTFNAFSALHLAVFSLNLSSTLTLFSKCFVNDRPFLCICFIYFDSPLLPSSPQCLFYRL